MPTSGRAGRRSGRGRRGRDGRASIRRSRASRRAGGGRGIDAGTRGDARPGVARLGRREPARLQRGLVGERGARRRAHAPARVALAVRRVNAHAMLPAACVSISCSITAQASASNGSGLRSTRSFGRARMIRPSSGIGAVRAVKRREVVVEREHERAAARRARSSPRRCTTSPRQAASASSELAVDRHRAPDDAAARRSQQAARPGRARRLARPRADSRSSSICSGSHGSSHRAADAGRVLDGAQPGPARRARLGARVRAERRPPRGGRVGRARGDALAADPGGGEDRPLLVRGARPVLRRRDRACCCRSSTRSCSGATPGSGCRSWARRSPSPRSSPPARREQLGEWVPQCYGTVDEPQVGAFCVSEPDAGSDVSSLRTRARYDEAKDEWVLNGQKAWATNGGIANVHVIIASVDPELGSRGQAGFIIPPGTQGLDDGHQGQEARPARLAHRRRLPRRLPRPRPLPARRQGEARRAPRARARGHARQEAGGDADLRGDAAERRRAGHRHRPRRLRVLARLRQGAHAVRARRSSRTRRSRSRSPTWRWRSTPPACSSGAHRGWAARAASSRTPRAR